MRRKSILNLGVPDTAGQLALVAERLAAVEVLVSGVASAQAVQTAAVVDVQADIADIQAILAGGGTPTPTTAPVFTVQPSISGTPAVGQILTGLDGTVIDGAPTSRRWLLNGSPVSTATTYAATAAGSLTYEVTAVGPGGTTVSLSTSVTIVSGGQLPAILLKPVGMNEGAEGITYYGTSYPFVDRSKTSSGWLRDDDGRYCPSNANGYPTAIPAGRPFIRILYNVEGANGVGSKQTYIWETTRTDATYAFAGGQITSQTQSIVGGKLRITLVLAGADAAGKGFYITLKCTNLPTPYSDDPVNYDYDTFVRADQASLLAAGEIFNPEWLARNTYSMSRFMDWQATNYNLHSEWSQRPLPRYATWKIKPDEQAAPIGVPIEIQVALCNKTGRNGWFNVPVKASPDYCQKLGQLLETSLNPGLLAIVEAGNEDWNAGFASYHYLYTLSPAIGTDDPAWGQTGYTGARIAANVCKGAGYSSRVRPALLTQTVRLEVTPGMFVGVDRAISEWADTTNANYNAEFAAHFKEAKQLFPYGGIATYLAGINSTDRSTNPAADKALIESWADDNAAGGTTGVTQAYEHMRFGNKLTTGTYDTLAGAMSSWSQALAPFIARGMVPVSYEGGFHLNADSTWADDDLKQANVVKLFGDISYDPRAEQFYLDMHKVARDLGIVYDCHLSDFAPRYTKVGIWGVVETLFAPQSPREKALKEFNASPTATADLNVTLTTSGVYQKNANPVTRIAVTGGLGLHKVTATGLAPGRQLNAAGTAISGALTAEGSTTLSVSVTDEAGNGPVVKQEVQNVLPAIAGKRYFILRVIEVANSQNQPISAGNVLPMASEVRFKNQDGSYISRNGMVVTGDQNGSPNETPAKLVDGDGATNWVGAPNKDNVLVFDFGDGRAEKPYQIEIMDRSDNPAMAPGYYLWSWSDNGVTGAEIFRTTKRDGSGPGNPYYQPDFYYGDYGPTHLSVATMVYP